MKRFAVCLMAGALLAMSTAAFAVPITVSQSGDASIPPSVVNSGFTKTGGTGPSYDSQITWFQPYSAATIPAAPDWATLYSAYPLGVASGPVLTSTGSLTIVASGVSDPGEAVWRGTSSSSWTAQLGTLVLSGGNYNTGDGTTLIGLSNVSWLAPTGFYAQVRVPGADQDVTVKSSTLNVTTHWVYSYTYDDGTAPPIPAPGAILLASMGAGLVSWLRARKTL